MPEKTICLILMPMGGLWCWILDTNGCGRVGVWQHFLSHKRVQDQNIRPVPSSDAEVWTRLSHPPGRPHLCCSTALHYPNQASPKKQGIPDIRSWVLTSDSRQRLMLREARITKWTKDKMKSGLTLIFSLFLMCLMTMFTRPRVNTKSCD